MLKVIGYVIAFPLLAISLIVWFAFVFVMAILASVVLPFYEEG